MTCRAYYFTSTGNTERAVGILKKELDAAGIETRLTRIEPGLRVERDGSPLVVAFPVYAFAPPVMVASFLKSLPSGLGADGSRTRASVLAVDGGGPMGAPWRAAAVLERRGYDIALVASASYPANWTQFAEPPAPRDAAVMMARGDAMAGAFAAAIASDDPSLCTRALKPPFGSRILSFLFGSIGRRFLAKLFIADADCDGCGLCARACPANAILMRGSGKGRPYWKTECESCNRCINVCPKKAIVTSIGRIASLSALAVGVCWAGIAAYAAFIAPAIVARLPAWAAMIANGLAVAAIVVIAHVAAIVLDRLIVSRIQRLPGFRRFFFWSFNKGTRRYRAEGWKPDLRPEAR